MEGLLQLAYIPTQSQLADLLIKILPSHQFHLLLSGQAQFTPHPVQLAGGVDTPSSDNIGPVYSLAQCNIDKAYRALLATTSRELDRKLVSQAPSFPNSLLAALHMYSRSCIYLY